MVSSHLLPLTPSVASLQPSADSALLPLPAFIQHAADAACPVQPVVAVYLFEHFVSVLLCVPVPNLGVVTPYNWTLVSQRLEILSDSGDLLSLSSIQNGPEGPFFT